MHASAVADIRDSYGVAFIGLVVSTMSVLPLPLLSDISPDLLDL